MRTSGCAPSWMYGEMMGSRRLAGAITSLSGMANIKSRRRHLPVKQQMWDFPTPVSMPPASSMETWNALSV
jgi:hypothetical protein